MLHYSENKKWWSECAEKIFLINDTDYQKWVCNLLFSYNIASNVHNVFEWARFLAMFLTHQDDEVRSYAYSLFNKNFYDIVKEFYFSWGDNSKLESEFESTWYNDTFFSSLIDNAPAMKKYFEIRSLLGSLDKNWKNSRVKLKMSIFVI